MLYAETVTAIKLACRECGEIHSVGIDTWGVDVGYVGKDGSVMRDEFRNYRNKDNAKVRTSLSEAERRRLFDISGISDNDFNTTYQLIARRRQGFDFDNIRHILFTPQLLGYMLTGVAATEQTIASTSGFYTKDNGYDRGFLNSLGIKKKCCPIQSALAL